LTYYQIQSLNGKVNKGERSTEIIFWNLLAEHRKDSKKTLTYEEFSKLSEPNKKDYRIRSFGRFYKVFNLEQTSGIDYPKTLPNVPLNERIEACEKVIKGYTNPPEIEYKNTNPCYIPSKDLIRIPPIDAFRDSASHYSVLYHELGHSTLVAHRCNRISSLENFKFGSHSYSFEELVAELCACFLCAYSQISNPSLDSNSQGYINSWSKKLQSDVHLLLRAAGQAQAAYRHILGINSNS
jgi:antirestriction protein ArdC